MGSGSPDDVQSLAFSPSEGSYTTLIHTFFFLATPCSLWAFLAPQSGIKPMRPCPLHWELGVFITRLPGKSLIPIFDRKYSLHKFPQLVINIWCRNVNILKSQLIPHLKVTFAFHNGLDSMVWNSSHAHVLKKQCYIISTFHMCSHICKWFTTDAHRHMWKKFFINFSHFITKCMLQTTWITYLCVFCCFFLNPWLQELRISLSFIKFWETLIIGVNRLSFCYLFSSLKLWKKNVLCIN